MSQSRRAGFAPSLPTLVALLLPFAFPGLLAPPAPAADAGDAAPFPAHLRDRGTGVPTSMFGTYVRRGQLLVYPFAEWYADGNLEYKPSELGFASDVDYRGRYSASEQLLFLGYGITNDLAVEMEGAYISAELDKSRFDPSAVPNEVEEAGLGDVEAQVRYRFLQERGSRPEAFTYFETVFPLQKNRRMIGTSDWEFKLGAGITRGYRWGTMTFRLAGEYVRDERKFEAGEYAIEYLRKLSPSWRIYTGIEGNQIDEITWITEAQWQLAPRAVLKVNNGWGLTPNATDFAPEAGVMFSF
jgi:hypothetical protein